MKKHSVKKATLALVERVIRVGTKEYLEGPPWCMGILHQPKRPIEKQQ